MSTSHGLTLTSRASSPGWTPVHRANAPSTNETTPPTVSSPKLVITASSANSPTPMRISSSPPTLSGSAFDPISATTIAMAPRIPEKKFGWNSSAMIP
jgi:hypothetical protein